MDLSTCTPGQRKIIETIDRPVMVAAGAGSGKTFTLTQRIARALVEWDDSVPGSGTIDRVMAITFTKKAASELRSRIKRLLVAEGMAREAQAIDDAWVSTIHGMASRILREHALEIGIDPAFEVVSESLADELRAEAVDDVVRELKDSGDPLVLELLRSAPMFSDGQLGEGIVDLCLRILARAEAMPRGLDGLAVEKPSRRPGDLVRDMCDLACDLRECAMSWKKPTKTEQGVVDAVESALTEAFAWLEESSAASFLDADFDVERFYDVLFAFPPTSDKFHDKKDDAGFFSDYRAAYASLTREAMASCGARRTIALICVARMIADRFASLKGPARLDNSDLLRLCARALEEHPGIADAYREQFDLIMIDEFQDTDKLQVSIIERIAKPGFGNVCTVGDAQQSIYRFRGADVNVFFSYRDSLKALRDDAVFVSLPDNFRSHADVLALVDKIFSQKEVFGSEFLHLEPRGRVNAEPDAVFDGFPRVKLDIVHHKPGTSKASGVSRSEAHLVSAERIALHFKELLDRGARAGDMALLLGTMSRADVFACALRAVGIESVIAGGSVFSGTEEAMLVSDLLRIAVDESDEPALYSVLTSRLFSVGDDALLALATGGDEEGRAVSRRLWRGFLEAGAPELELPERDAAALDHALVCMRRFIGAARGASPSAALRTLFVSSGILDRLARGGAAGLSYAGNLEKAVRIVASLEVGSSGISSLAFAYREHLRTAKEAPGSLATVSSDYVRIMTVHASKGLEFPHVAIADLGKGDVRLGSVLCENVGESTYLSTVVSPDGDAGKAAAKALKFAVEDDAPAIFGETMSPGDLHHALESRVRDESLAEARRLLYVALTRASKSLLLSYVTRSKPQDGYSSDGIYRDVHQALCWDADVRPSRSLCAYGGSAPAQVDVAYLSLDQDRPADAPEEDGEASCAPVIAEAPECFVVPMRSAARPPFVVAAAGVRSDMKSYSSLSRSAQDESQPSFAFDQLDTSSERSFDPDEDATALGSAFHLIAQRSIEEASKKGASVLERPSHDVFEARAGAFSLTSAQIKRLDEALDRWFASDVAAQFASFGTMRAEVSFLVPIDRSATGRETVYLEGEIDGLADDGRKGAFFVDYKTGGHRLETREQLEEKHRLQAQCYAYALLRSGYRSVEARFVRVEQTQDSGIEPQVVAYSFGAEDLSSLEMEISARYA